MYIVHSTIIYSTLNLSCDKKKCPINKDETFLWNCVFCTFFGKIMTKTLSSAWPSLFVFLLRFFLWLLVYPLLLLEVSVQ